jgi:Enoyl-(Acyl carrier protein) reductase
MPGRIYASTVSRRAVETARYLRNFKTLDAARASPHTLVGRLGTPDEIADGAVYLAGEESTFMTGADLLIDGGYTAVCDRHKRMQWSPGTATLAARSKSRRARGAHRGHSWSRTDIRRRLAPVASVVLDL